MCICGLGFSLFFYCLQIKLPKSHPDTLCQPQFHTSRPLCAVTRTDSRKHTLLHFVACHRATLIYACWSSSSECSNTYTAQLSHMRISYYPNNRCTSTRAHTYSNIWQSQANCRNSMNFTPLHKTHKHFISTSAEEVRSFFCFAERSVCSQPVIHSHTCRNTTKHLCLHLKRTLRPFWTTGHEWLLTRTRQRWRTKCAYGHTPLYLSAIPLHGCLTRPHLLWGHSPTSWLEVVPE